MTITTQGIEVIKRFWQSTWRFWVLIAILWIGGWLYWQDQIYYPSTYDAYLLTPIVRISTQVNGEINSINVKPGSFVKKGQLMFSLVSTPEQLAVVKAQVQLQKAQQTYQSELDNVDINQNNLTKAQNHYQLIAHDYARNKTLFERGIISKASMEMEQTDYNNALQNVNIAKANLAQSKLTGSLVNVKAAQNALKRAQLQLSYTKVYAPTSGFITYFHLTKGQYVATGETLFGQLDAAQMYVQANVLEMFLRHVRVGQKVTFVLRMYPNKKYYGVVSAMGYAISSFNTKLSVAPTVQPAFDWVHIARRFPVYIKVTSPHDFQTHPFRSGASAWVKVDTRTHTLVKK